MSNKHEKHYSPVGTAAYPWLNIPDTKYGIYQVNLIMSKEEAKTINDKIKAVMPKNAKNNYPAVYPEVIKDDEGVESKTGNYVVKFKLRPEGKNNKTGETWPNKPVIFDAAGNIDKKSWIGSGSRLVVCYELVPYDQSGGGVSLRIVAVQIAELVEYVGSGDTWGGGIIEGGYVGEDDDEGEEYDEKANQTSDDGEDDEDF